MSARKARRARRRVDVVGMAVSISSGAAMAVSLFLTSRGDSTLQALVSLWASLLCGLLLLESVAGRRLPDLRSPVVRVLLGVATVAFAMIAYKG